MDWKDFMRGFFGGRPTTGGEGRDVWPPPPPIPDFGSKDNQQNDSNPPREEGLVWGQHGGQSDRGFEDFGNSRFVFGNLFSAMGEMFQEMERSMRDMEGFFGSLDIHGGEPKMIPFSSQMPPLPPPAKQESPKAKTKEDSLRDFVLKEPDTKKERDNYNNSKHYIPAPSNANEKVDRDLDDLYKNSKLDLSDLPVPSTSQDTTIQPHSPPGIHISPFGRHGGVTSSFQKTYQTFSFRNGRWEGEMVKEDQNGKEVTRYYQDKDGQRHETTEYFPRDGSPPQRPATITIEPSTDIMLPPSVNEPTRIFQFFDKFFKPRM